MFASGYAQSVMLVVGEKIGNIEKRILRGKSLFGNCVARIFEKEYILVTTESFCIFLDSHCWFTDYRIMGIRDSEQ